MEGLQLKRKIRREKPNKKWREEEVKTILSYLQEAPEIEAPTAQIYYKKLIQKSGIDASWDLIKWKVRHLKSCLKKANDWRKSTDARLLAADGGTSSVEGKVLQICPHYKKLTEIFGAMPHGESVYDVIDSDDTASMDESLSTILNESMQKPALFAEPDNKVICSAIMAVERASFTEEICVNTDNEMPSSTQASGASSPVIPIKAKVFAKKIKKHAPKSSVAYLAAFQADRKNLFNIKFEWEKEKHMQEVKLKEAEIDLRKQELELKRLEIEKDERLKSLEIEREEQEEKTKAEIDFRKQELELKRLEIEKDERLKTLEIERDERLTKYEIELKYKNKFS